MPARAPTRPPNQDNLLGGRMGARAGAALCAVRRTQNP